jgi:hypothetical protein
MIMVQCHTLLPDLPVRTIELAKTPDFPIGGIYDLIECFCNDPKCDCRRVSICVVAQANHQKVAHISYGWESVDFYLKWSGSIEEAQFCSGSYLDPLNPQSEYAAYFLFIFQNYVLQDSLYTERLKKHYLLFKSALKTNPFPKLKLLSSKNSKSKKRYRK